MSKKLFVLLSFFVLAFFPSCSLTNPSKGGIEIESAWARPAIAGNPSAVYFVIENNSSSDEKLLSADSSVSEFTEIHLSSDVDGTMKMMKQDFVEIKSKNILEFKPMSYHIMLINLKNDLKIDDVFELNLTFEKSGTKEILVEVKENK
ncbi:MAG TPA: copper chaperone PCu(A)C [Anaerolineaceae bacterium]|nr:copper chaperone PCu(A)C [Anaerolineaceae bacterium]